MQHHHRLREVERSFGVGRELRKQVRRRRREAGDGAA
jgi:hypothetical protein